MCTFANIRELQLCVTVCIPEGGSDSPVHYNLYICSCWSSVDGDDKWSTKYWKSSVQDSGIIYGQTWTPKDAWIGKSPNLAFIWHGNGFLEVILCSFTHNIGSFSLTAISSWFIECNIQTVCHIQYLLIPLSMGIILYSSLHEVHSPKAIHINISTCMKKKSI